MCGENMVADMGDIGNIEHDEDANDGRHFWDDTSGEKLDPKLTRAARKEEVEAIHDMVVYRKVPIAMWIAETGRRPIGTRWVDSNKGDKLCLKIRSGLLAQELNLSRLFELYAATPPLEFIKYLISFCASSQGSSRPTQLTISDVKKAYFYAPATRRVFVALPLEDQGPGEEGMCALLERSLYGTRDAAYNWIQVYTTVLCKKLGF